jgi:hypothetical protein
MAFSAVVIRYFMRTSLNVFHPFVILFGVSIIDVYFPGAIWSVTQIPAQPEWVAPLTGYDVIQGILIYLASYILMLAGYFLLGSFVSNRQVNKIYTLKEGMFTPLLWILLGLCFLQIATTVMSFGSIPEWFYHKIMVRWDGGLGDDHETSAFELLPLRVIFSMLVIVGFYYRNNVRRPIMLGYVFPVLGLILAALTFFRGSILVYLLGLLFAERARKRRDVLQKFPATKPSAVVDKTLIKWGAVAVCLFLAYGAIRQQLSSDAWSDTGATASASASTTIPFAKGDGLVGVASIVKFFDSPKDIFMGKTYLDMLLLPVPRFIYTSKPKWYGIDDITRSMGWAESTQSAVTMPGEAFANFWYFSLAFMVVMGMFFGLIDRFTCGNGEFGLILYPSVLLYVVINSNWMAFTGIANQMISTIMCAIILRCVYRVKKIDAISRIT